MNKDVHVYSHFKFIKATDKDLNKKLTVKRIKKRRFVKLFIGKKQVKLGPKKAI